MHETSLGGTLRDYLSGDEIEETTFEEFRQLLARLMVEEKGYPKERITPKVMLRYTVDGTTYERRIDFVVHNDAGAPIFLVMFCAGDVGSFEREMVCAARLYPGGPIPYVMVTDTMNASLLNVKTGEAIRHGLSALPTWDEINAMFDVSDMSPLTDEQRDKQSRIFHAYSGLLCGCEGTCDLPDRPKE